MAKKEKDPNYVCIRVTPEAKKILDKMSDSVQALIEKKGVPIKFYKGHLLSRVLIDSSILKLSPEEYIKQSREWPEGY